MSLGITVCHHSASLMMPNGDPRDRFFYPTLTLMIDSYNLLARIWPFFVNTCCSAHLKQDITTTYDMYGSYQDYNLILLLYVVQ